MTHTTDDELFPTTTFAVADPRTFDGDPYEVAERSVRQLSAVVGVAEALFDATDKMARNAEMERNIIDTGEPMGSEWRESPLGKQLGNVGEELAALRKRLAALAQAAGFNPRAPLPKE